MNEEYLKKLRDQFGITPEISDDDFLGAFWKEYYPDRKEFDRDSLIVDFATMAGIHTPQSETPQVNALPAVPAPVPVSLQDVRTRFGLNGTDEDILSTFAASALPDQQFDINNIEQRNQVANEFMKFVADEERRVLGESRIAEPINFERSLAGETFAGAIRGVMGIPNAVLGLASVVTGRPEFIQNWREGLQTFMNENDYVRKSQELAEMDENDIPIMEKMRHLNWWAGGLGEIFALSVPGLGAVGPGTKLASKIFSGWERYTRASRVLDATSKARIAGKAIPFTNSTIMQARAIKYSADALTISMMYEVPLEMSEAFDDLYHHEENPSFGKVLLASGAGALSGYAGAFGDMALLRIFERGILDLKLGAEATDAVRGVVGARILEGIKKGSWAFAKDASQSVFTENLQELIKDTVAKGFWDPERNFIDTDTMIETSGLTIGLSVLYGALGNARRAGNYVARSSMPNMADRLARYEDRINPERERNIPLQNITSENVDSIINRIKKHGGDPANVVVYVNDRLGRPFSDGVKLTELVNMLPSLQEIEAKRFVEARSIEVDGRTIVFPSEESLSLLEDRGERPLVNVVRRGNSYMTEDGSIAETGKGSKKRATDKANALALNGSIIRHNGLNHYVDGVSFDESTATYDLVGEDGSKSTVTIDINNVTSLEQEVVAYQQKVADIFSAQPEVTNESNVVVPEISPDEPLSFRMTVNGQERTVKLTERQAAEIRNIEVQYNDLVGRMNATNLTDEEKQVRIEAFRLMSQDEKRRVAGILTDKEKPKMSRGREVVVDGRAARVVATPPNRVKVEFEDGTTKTVPRDDVQVTEVTSVPDLEAASNSILAESQLIEDMVREFNTLAAKEDRTDVEELRYRELTNDFERRLSNVDTSSHTAMSLRQTPQTREPRVFINKNNVFPLGHNLFEYIGPDMLEHNIRNKMKFRGSNPISKDDLAGITLYHATTNLSGVHHDGILIGYTGEQENTGLGGISKAGVSFTTDAKIADAIANDLRRVIQLAKIKETNAEDLTAILSEYARTDEALYGMEEGALQDQVDRAVQGFVRNVMIGSQMSDSYIVDSYHDYSNFRSQVTDIPFSNILTKPEQLARLDPSEVGVVQADPANIPDSAYIYEGTDDNLGEIRVAADVPVGRLRSYDGRTGVEVSVVERAINDFIGDRKGKANYRAVRSFYHLPTELQKMLTEAYGGDLNIRAEGVFHNGTVYIIADNVPTRTGALRGIIRHESIHAGLGEALDGKLNATLLQIFSDHKNSVIDVSTGKTRKIREGERSFFDKLLDPENYGGALDRNSELGKIRAAEEFIANVAEYNTDNNFLQTLYAQFRNALRSMGITLTFTDNDIRHIIRSSHQYAKDGMIVTTRPPVESLSKTSSMWYSRLDNTIRSSNKIGDKPYSAQVMKNKIVSLMSNGLFQEAEYKWSALDIFLDGKIDRGENITKQDVLDYLDKHNVKIVEKWHREATDNPEYNALREDAENIVTEIDRTSTDLADALSAVEGLSTYAPNHQPGRFEVSYESDKGRETFMFNFLNPSNDFALYQNTLIERLKLEFSGVENIFTDEVLSGIDERISIRTDITDRLAHFKLDPPPVWANYQDEKLVIDGAVPGSQRELVFIWDTSPLTDRSTEINTELSRLEDILEGDEFSYRDNDPEAQSKYDDIINRQRSLLREQVAIGRRIGDYSHPHWEQYENVVAHIRMNDRIVEIDGKQQKMLFIEELQSDWHQEGRERGYKDRDEVDNISRRLSEINQEMDRRANVLGNNIQNMLSNESVLTMGQEDALNDLYVAVIRNDHNLTYLSHTLKKIKDNNIDVPGLDGYTENLLRLKREAGENKDLLTRHNLAVADAPFKESDGTDYNTLAIRRLTHFAAENGYDGIAWTSGDMQTSRYSPIAQALRSGVADGIRVSTYSGVAGKTHKKFSGLRRGNRLFDFNVYDHEKVERQYLGNLYDRVFDPEVQERNRRDYYVLKSDTGDVYRGKNNDGSWGILEFNSPEEASGFLDDNNMRGEYGVHQEFLINVEISGEQIEGKGFNKAYNERLPNAMKKFGKQFGARLGTTELDIPAAHYKIVGDSGLYSGYNTLERAQNSIEIIRSDELGLIQHQLDRGEITPEQAEFENNRIRNKEYDIVGYDANEKIVSSSRFNFKEQVQYVTIPESMKQLVEDGMPLFKKSEHYVYTDEFKDFFGDWDINGEHSSKVVDDNGNPATLFTNDNKTAAEDGEGRPVYVSIKNPVNLTETKVEWTVDEGGNDAGTFPEFVDSMGYIMHELGMDAQFAISSFYETLDQMGIHPMDMHTTFEQLIEAVYMTPEIQQALDMTSGDPLTFTEQILQGMGYDGIQDGSNWTAFDHSQFMPVNEKGDYNQDTTFLKKSDVLTTGDILNVIGERLGIRTRTGRGRNEYKNGRLNVRQETDMNTLTELVGEYVYEDYSSDILLQAPASVVAEIKKELKSVNSNEKKAFADLLARYLRGEDIATLYPNFAAQLDSYNQNNNLGDALGAIREVIEAYNSQDDLRKARARVWVNGMPRPNAVGFREKAYRTAESLYNNWIDDQYYTYKAMREINGGEMPANITENFYVHARMRRAADGVGNHFITKGVRTVDGRELGPSLMAAIGTDILSDPSTYYDFSVYAVGERAKELYKQRAAGQLPANYIIPLSQSEITAIDNDVSSKNQQQMFSEAFDRMQEYNKAILEFAVDEGVLSREGADMIMTMNERYVPWNRLFFDKDNTRVENQKRYVNKKSGPIKKKSETGADHIFDDPIGTLIDNTFALVGHVHQQRVYQSMWGHIPDKDNKVVGQWIRKYEPQIKVNNLPLRDIMNTLQKEGRIDPQTMAAIELILNQSGVDVTDTILSFFGRDYQMLGQQNIVRVMVEGKPQYMELHPLLWEALEGASVPENNTFIRLLSYPTKILRAGATSLNPLFAPINFTRDYLTRAMQSSQSLTIFETFADPALILSNTFAGTYAKKLGVRNKLEETPTGGYEQGTRNGLYNEFVVSGGFNATISAIDRSYATSVLKEIRRPSLGQVGKTISHALNPLHPIRSGRNLASGVAHRLREFNDMFENVNRMAEFKAVYERELRTFDAQIKATGKKATKEQEIQAKKNAMLKAGFEARNVTIDFARAGKTMRTVNQIVPFSNAAVQGVARFMDSIAQNPTKASFFTMMYIIAPSMLLALNNWENPWYQNQSDYIRDMFWLIPNPAGDHDEEGYPKDFIKIAKPHVWGLIGSFTERYVEWLGKNHPEAIDEMRHNAFKGFAMLPKATGEIFDQGFGESVSLHAPINPLEMIYGQGNFLQRSVASMGMFHVQAAKPALEVVGNFSEFSQGPIENPYTQRTLDPDRRYNPNTSKFARRISSLMVNVMGPDSAVLSPVQIDHLINGYTAGLGRLGVHFYDRLVDPKIDTEEEMFDSRSSVWNVGVTQPLARVLVAEGSNYAGRSIGRLYEHLSKAEQTAGTFDSLQAKNSPRTQSYFENNRHYILMHKDSATATIRNDLREINTAIRNVMDMRIDPEVKRQQLDELLEIKTRVSMTFLERYEAALNSLIEGNQ
jgi:hypothetical protein